MSPAIGSNASELADLFGNVPDHLVQVGVLLGVAVDQQLDAALAEVTSLPTRWIGPIGAERSKLCRSPGASFVAHRALQVRRVMSSPSA